MSETWEGLLLLDKPSGPTSHDIVDRVRKLTGQKRVGHAGTLDPMATGLLPVLLGRGTRLARFLPGSPKVYSGTIRLGTTTATDDTTGEILETWSGVLPPPEAVVLAAGSVRQETLQIPPTVSARKIGGERSYRLARRGESVAGKATPVSVFRFDVAPTSDPREWSFLAEVTAGTYIRAMARDLGAVLGCGAALSSLRRSRIGSLDVEDSVSLGENPPASRLLDSLIPLERIPLSVPSVLLPSGDLAARFAHGVAVLAPDEALSYATCTVLDPAGRLLGVAEVVEKRLHPRVVLLGDVFHGGLSGTP